MALTQKEIEEGRKYYKSIVAQQEAAKKQKEQSAAPAGPSNSPSFMEMTKKIFGDIKNSYNEREGNIAKAIGEGQQGKRSYGGTAFKVLGEVGGLVGDAQAEVALPLANKALDMTTWDPIEAPLRKAGSAVMGAAKKNIIDPIAAKAGEFAKNNPGAADAIGSAGNIASALPILGVGAAKGVPKLAQGMVDASEAAVKIPGAVKALPGNAKAMITPVDEQVRTILSDTARSADLDKKLTEYMSQAKKAAADPRIATPYDAAGKKQFQAAMTKVSDNLNTYGQSKKTALKEIGDTVVPGIKDVRKSFDEGLGEVMGVGIKNGEMYSQPGRMSIMDPTEFLPTDSQLIKQVDRALNALGPNPTVRQIDDVVDRLQNAIYSSEKNLAQPVNTQLSSVAKRVTEQINEAAKVAADRRAQGESLLSGAEFNGKSAYRTANERYSSAIKIKQQLNKALGNEYKNAGSIMKRLFSPQDGGLKDLVNKLESETGIKIFEDATLAKFSMEALQDPRVRTLLEGGIPTSKAGWAEKIIKLLERNLMNPEGKARKIISAPPVPRAK